jgi:hypothetical protein
VSAASAASLSKNGRLAFVKGAAHFGSKMNTNLLQQKIEAFANVKIRLNSYLCRDGNFEAVAEAYDVQSVVLLKNGKQLFSGNCKSVVRSVACDSKSKAKQSALENFASSCGFYGP